MAEAVKRAMPDARVTKEDLTDALMDLIAADHPVFTRWITDEELAANPGLGKAKNVRPPTGSGRIRLVGIGEGGSIIPFQSTPPVAGERCTEIIGR